MALLFKTKSRKKKVKCKFNYYFQVGSRLISRAGGLNKLAVLPPSTLQILGADKKLFRYVD